MKSLLVAILPCALFAQSSGAPWTDFSAYTPSSNLYNAINAKPNFQLAPSAPATCTAGKDWYFNSTTQSINYCSAASTWSGLLSITGSSGQAGAIAFGAGTPSLPTAGQTGWVGPATVSAPYYLAMPSAPPVSGQFLVTSAPSSGVSALLFTTPFAGMTTPTTVLCDHGAGIVGDCGTNEAVVPGIDIAGFARIRGTLDLTGDVIQDFTMLIPGGNAFSVSGCGATYVSGKASSGTFTSGTTGTCTVTITPNGTAPITATNGWICFATSGSVAFVQTASSTTTCTLQGTTTSGDTIRWFGSGS